MNFEFMADINFPRFCRRPRIILAPRPSFFSVQHMAVGAAPADSTWAILSGGWCVILRKL